ncbi:MAG TPA: hypothetical protein PK408_10700, partial [Treponemataceae bacterium]|nr:hypothetical protein [Treponemataceae bacterium]
KRAGSRTVQLPGSLWLPLLAVIPSSTSCTTVRAKARAAVQTRKSPALRRTFFMPMGVIIKIYRRY